MSTKWEDFKKELGLPDEAEPKETADMGKKGGVMLPDDDESLLRQVKDMPLVEEIRRFLSVSKVKRAFALGTELFNAATPFLDKPSWWTAGKAVFAMGKTMIEDVEVYSEDYFSGDEWTEPYSQDFTQTLLHVLQKFPYERIKTAEENSFIRLATLPNGLRVGWTYTGRLQLVDNIYVETPRLDEAKEYIKALLWEQFEGKSLVMRKNNRLVLKENEARVIFEEDDAFESKLSKRAIEYAGALKRPIEAGVPRTVMFYGPPGTGKSTMARTIVDLMGFRSFRIRIADLGQLDNSTLFEALNIFQPDSVILDDFDRTHHQAQLLETLEYFQEKVKLVIVTVNNRRKLDDALQRPGRIDEIELIDKMDEEVVRHVLGKYVDGFDLVRDWPIAFINEYVIRRTYLSSEEAAASVKELAKRVKALEKYRDEDDEGMGRMLALIKAAQALGQAPAKVATPVDAPPALAGDEDEVTPDQLKDLILEELQTAIAEQATQEALKEAKEGAADEDGETPFDPSEDQNEDTN